MVACPNCGKDGLEVDRITVIIHTKESKWPITDEIFFYCENPRCKTVYFTASGSQVFLKTDLKSRVTFKESTSPKPLCYCKQVTEEDVVRAIEHGASTLEEVKKKTGIGGGGFCKYTNPMGRCCSRNYMPFIQNQLKKKGRTGVRKSCCE